MHSRKFFNNIALWIKKEAGDTDFDIAMGCFDSVEISELFGVYVLNVLGEMYGKERVGCIETVAELVLKILVNYKLKRLRKILGSL